MISREAKETILKMAATGDDSLVGGSGMIRSREGPAVTILPVTPATNTSQARWGDDDLDGGDDDDILDGGDDDDLLNGGSGTDDLLGGDGER